MSESTVTFEEGLKLLELPRELGVHPESNEPVVAGLGRFGPYVKHGPDYRSLEPTDDLFTVDLERALALFAAPKRSGRRQAAKRVIRQIDVPGGAPALQVLEGRYGPYVTDGETNASIPNGVDPATLSLDEAQALLESRRGAAPRAGRRRAAATKSRPARARKAVIPKVAASSPAPSSPAPARVAAVSPGAAGGRKRKTKPPARKRASS
jgi:DNA topoisomerase-1